MMPGRGQLPRTASAGRRRAGDRPRSERIPVKHQIRHHPSIASLTLRPTSAACAGACSNASATSASMFTAVLSITVTPPTRKSAPVRGHLPRHKFIYAAGARYITAAASSGGDGTITERDPIDYPFESSIDRSRTSPMPGLGKAKATSASALPMKPAWATSTAAKPPPKTCARTCRPTTARTSTP